METYLVGGAVRDSLLGLPVRERDWVVVGGTPLELETLGFRQVGKDFPVFLHPQTHEEYALARTERKTAPGYHGFETRFSPDVSLDEDLLRRDLTINAIAQSTTGELIDPYGGVRDLSDRILRHVSPAFAEDPVRILRLARFAARFARLGFTVAPDTLTLMRGMTAAGEVDALVAERVWAETAKALSEPSPAVYFQTLRDCGALAVVFPEIDRLYGVPQPPRWHPEIDTGIHVQLVLTAAAALSPEPRVRFAALLHDLGKGTTPSHEWPKHHGHEHRGVKIIEALCARLRVPNEYRDLAVMASREHGNVHRAMELRPDTVLGLLERCDALRRPERFHELLLTCIADARGRTGFEDADYPQAVFFRKALEAVRAVAIEPQERSGLGGAAIGRLLGERRLHALESLCRDRPTKSQ
jgi:tRNA nucleotidyltransferase (CCA-adding enzyme)